MTHLQKAYNDRKITKDGLPHQCGNEALEFNAGWALFGVLGRQG